MAGQASASEGYRCSCLHTHSHGDHTAGDGQFAERPDTAVVARRATCVALLRLPTTPTGSPQVDSAAAVLDCLATPGHHEAAVTFYDRDSGILLTGDTVYPGRLYVVDWPAFVRSIGLIATSAPAPGTPTSSVATSR